MEMWQQASGLMCKGTTAKHWWFSVNGSLQWPDRIMGAGAVSYLVTLHGDAAVDRQCSCARGTSPSGDGRRESWSQVGIVLQELERWLCASAQYSAWGCGGGAGRAAVYLCKKGLTVGLQLLLGGWKLAGGSHRRHFVWECGIRQTV